MFSEKKIGIWMGQLKVKVIHASVTQKCWAECNKTMRRFGLDCVKLSGLSAWVAWQLNTIQTKSTHDLAHLAQHFVSDGACFTLTFNCPIQISKFFHKTSPVRCPLPGHLIKSVDIEKNSQSTKTSYWSARGQTIKTWTLTPSLPRVNGTWSSFSRGKPIIIY